MVGQKTEDAHSHYLQHQNNSLKKEKLSKYMAAYLLYGHFMAILE
jgi:hypothetical protein